MMVNDIVALFISPLLRRAGFKKKRLTWNREVNGLTQVVDLQVSRFSAPGEERCTINIGVFYPDVWRTCWAKEIPGFINEEDCFPRIRIGQLLADFSQDAKDHWWTCSTEEKINGIGKEIRKILEEKCLPFLDDMLDRRNVIKLYSSGSMKLTPIDMIYLAIMQYSVGDVDSAMGLMREVSTISNAWSDRVDAILSRLG